MSDRNKTLSDKMQQIMLAMVQSDALVRLIGNDGNDPLAIEFSSSPYSLLYSRIFPFPFTPGVANESGTYVNILFDNFHIGKSNSYFEVNEIVIVVLCHNSNWQIKGAIRPFLITEEIKKVFNGRTDLGIGELKFSVGNITWANDKFSGYKMRAKVVDFN